MVLTPVVDLHTNVNRCFNHLVPSESIQFRMRFHSVEDVSENVDILRLGEKAGGFPNTKGRLLLVPSQHPHLDPRILQQFQCCWYVLLFKEKGKC